MDTNQDPSDKPVTSPHPGRGLSVLIVEDETDLSDLLAAAMAAHGFRAACAGTAGEAAERLGEFAYDAVVVDLRLPDADGLTVLETALERYPDIVAVVMTGYGGVTEAVAAMKRGAVDFLIKPFAPGQLARLLSSEFDRRRLGRENAALQARLRGPREFGEIVGHSPAMQRVLSVLALVIPMNSTVLIQGETGTGKELIARTIHRNSPRGDQRFVAFNAAAIPESLAEAELFGHAKGAFTGAVGNRVGRFELAHRGTLFIDEVGLMPLALQAKLLRALQEREIERVGESRPIKFDARVIAASNVDLGRMVKAGTFREDLYYRLNVIRLPLPPLRERREDIPALAQHFVNSSSRLNNVAVKTLGQDTVRCLMDYPWPGNIRQLENAMEHAVAMSASLKDQPIPVDALPEEIRQPERSPVLPSLAIPEEGVDFVSVVSQLERDLILRSLEMTGGNKRRAARLLQLSRTTLIDKLHRLQLDEAAPAAKRNG